MSTRQKVPLKYFLTHNLRINASKETAEELGDRSKYIGASDIGSCLRKSYLGKVNHLEHDLEQLIIFGRGHVAENLVEKMLTAEMWAKLERQVEVTGEVYGIPTQAHIDFLVRSKTECVVIEVKTTSQKLAEPYESWVLQVQWQIYLLRQKYHGISIRACVVAVDLNTGWLETFWIEENSALLSVARANAEQLAIAMKTGNEPEAEVQLYCHKCPFKGDCPKIRNGSPKELPDEVEAMIEKIRRLRPYEKEVKELKKQIEAFMDSVGTKTATYKDTTIKKVAMPGKKMINIERLRRDYPDIAAEHEIDGEGYSYIKVI